MKLPQTLQVTSRNVFGALVLAGLVVPSGVNAESEISLPPKATAEEIAIDFRDVPVLETAYVETAPIEVQGALPTGDLAGQADIAAIVGLAGEISDGTHGRIDSFLIARGGRLIFESYFRRGRVNLPHPQASSTKALTSLALGRAIQLGHLTIEDLDRPLADFFDGADPEKFVEGTLDIRLRDALTMQSGLRFDDEQKARFDEALELPEGRPVIQDYYEQSSPVAPDSMQFEYQESDPTLVMRAIDASVPGGAEAFVASELFPNLAISNYGWDKGGDGKLLAGFGSRLTSRDMVKLGIMTMNGGRWQGEQLISETFIEQALARSVSLPDDDIFGGGEDVANSGYGYFFWQADIDVDGRRFHTVSAQGGGGQFIIMVKELDLVVVFTGHDRNPTALQLLADKIVPAFLSTSSD